MTTPESLLVGKVLKSHGVKGKALVHSMTDFPERFEPGSRLLLGSDESDLRPVVVAASSIHKGKVLLTFIEPPGGDDGEGEIIDPHTMEGKYLFVSCDDLVGTAEDEYYYHELIGKRVETIGGDYIGVVDNVIRAASQDLLLLDGGERGEIFIPVVASIVKTVDKEAGKIIIDPPDGLLDINNTKC